MSTSTLPAIGRESLLTESSIYVPGDHPKARAHAACYLPASAPLWSFSSGPFFALIGLVEFLTDPFHQGIDFGLTAGLDFRPSTEKVTELKASETSFGTLGESCMVL